MLFTKRQFKPSTNHVGEEMLKKSVCWHKKVLTFFTYCMLYKCTV